MSRPGQVLADMYEVTRTTISRVKKGENHSQYKEEYERLPLEERKAIYKIFCESSNFYEKKVNSTIIQSKRRLTEQQVHMVLLNSERKLITWTKLMRKWNIKSDNTFLTIIKGQSYKDYALTYKKLTDTEKDQLASLLRN